MSKNLISLKVNCPRCGKSLMDYTQYHNGKPSIKLLIDADEKSGTINLCSSYGCYEKSSTIDLVEGETARLFCTHCKEHLTGTDTCRLCQAPMVDFACEKGGMVHVCSRIGCKNHYVSFEDIYDTLRHFYDAYEYGAHESDF